MAFHEFTCTIVFKLFLDISFTIFFAFLTVVNEVNQGSGPVTREPDMALLVTASGSLAHRKVLPENSSKYASQVMLSAFAKKCFSKTKHAFSGIWC